MSIFKSIKNSIVNTTTDIADLTRGFTSIVGDAVTDNSITKAISTTKEHGKAKRLEAKAAKAEAKKAKALEQLEKLQAKLEAKKGKVQS